MTRWLSFLWFVLVSQWRLKSAIALGARVKFPRFVHLGRDCRIRAGCHLDAPGPDALVLGDRVQINRGAYLGAFAPLRIGDRSDINRNASIDARGAVSIGRDVLIGPYAQIIAYQHVFAAPEQPINTQGLRVGPISIGDDVWIGAGAIILADVSIGHGSIVGAGAVVTRSCAPFSILAGAPARVIGRRDNQPVAAEQV